MLQNPDSVPALCQLVVTSTSPEVCDFRGIKSLHACVLSSQTNVGMRSFRCGSMRLSFLEDVTLKERTGQNCPFLYEPNLRKLYYR